MGPHVYFSFLVGVLICTLLGELKAQGKRQKRKDSWARVWYKEGLGLKTVPLCALHGLAAHSLEQCS